MTINSPEESCIKWKCWLRKLRRICIESVAVNQASNLFPSLIYMFIHLTSWSLPTPAPSSPPQHTQNPSTHLLLFFLRRWVHWLYSCPGTSSAVFEPLFCRGERHDLLGGWKEHVELLNSHFLLHIRRNKCVVEWD